MINGWIYCITNSYFKTHNIYKIEGIINTIYYRKPTERITNFIINKNKFYFNNVNIIELLAVNNIRDAEDHLFSLISDYNISNNFYKTDYETNLKHSFDYIKKIYCPNYIVPVCNKLIVSKDTI